MRVVRMTTTGRPDRKGETDDDESEGGRLSRVPGPEDEVLCALYDEVGGVAGAGCTVSRLATRLGWSEAATRAGLALMAGREVSLVLSIGAYLQELGRVRVETLRRG